MRILILALVLSLNAALPALAAVGGSPTMKVVVQLNDGDPDKIEAGLRNITHILEAAGKEKTPLEMTVVVFGAPLPVFKKDNGAASNVIVLQNIMKKNKQVALLGCQNTLNRFGIKATDLIEGFKVVPSGALEVLRLEQRGYLYYRP